MSSLHQIAETFLSAFQDLSTDLHISLRSPTCNHIFAPSSLNLPPKTNTTFAQHLNNLKSTIKSFPVTAKEIHINDSDTKKQIVIWATGKPEFREEVMDVTEQGGNEEWEYYGEYIFILDVNEGEGLEGRIERILEFLDSKNTMRLLGLMGRARAKLEEIKGQS